MTNEAEKKMQQSLAALEIQKGYIESLTNQIEMVQLAINEHVVAKETVSQYIKLKEGHELLFPIGANSFLFATKAKEKKAIVGVGAGVSIEENLDKAVERIDSKLKMLNEKGEELTKQLSEVQHQAETLSEKIRREMEEGKENVQETKGET